MPSSFAFPILCFHSTTLSTKVGWASRPWVVEASTRHLDSTCRPFSSPMTDVTSVESFQESSKTGIVVVSFWAPWCEPSIHINTVMDQLAKAKPSIKFLKVEAEELSEISSHYNIESVPTVLILKNFAVLDTLVGANPPELTKKVNALSPTSPSVISEETKEDINKRCEKLINSNKVMVFMKGTPDQPACGFSSKFVSMISKTGVPFGSFNILSDQAIREGIKKFSNWPTFPQLYVNGKLVGGVDILKELEEDGELESTLKGE